jgi:hypothetical protein
MRRSIMSLANNYPKNNDTTVYPLQDTYRVSGLGVYQYSQTGYIVQVPTGDDDSTIRTFSISDFHNRERDSFLFHDACWNIMQTCFYTSASIPLGRLAEALRQSPSQRPGTCHNPCTPQDPTKHIDAQDIIGRRKKQPKPRFSAAQMAPSCTTNDTFAALPPEIRHEVAQYLPTVDFYNLRLASRSMGQLFFDSTFWATRFEVDGERGFLSCLKQKRLGEHAEINDWQAIYSCSSAARLSWRLMLRNDFWRRYQWFKDVTTMSIQPDQSDINQKSLGDWHWREVQGHLRCDEDLPLRPYPDYAKVLRTYGVFIPHGLAAIVVSLIKEESTTYITGLRFLSAYSAASLGYISSGSPIIHTSADFSGFMLAVSENGIHALKVLPSEGTSSWIGNPVACSITRRLALQNPVKALEGRFDVS